MSRLFSRFLGPKWDEVTVKGQPKEQEESSPSSGPSTVLLVDDKKGNASYSGEVSQDSSAKDTSTDTSEVTLIQDVSKEPPSKSKGL
jgi:hypothetical protein